MYSNPDSKTKLYFAGSKWEDEPIMTVQEMSYYLRQILAILRVRPARVQPERTAAAKLVISKWNLPVENEIQLANLEKKFIAKRKRIRSGKAHFLFIISLRVNNHFFQITTNIFCFFCL